MNAFAYDDKYAIDEEPPRNFVDEAFQIADGKSRLMPQRDHVKALVDVIRMLTDAEEREI